MEVSLLQIDSLKAKIAELESYKSEDTSGMLLQENIYSWDYHLVHSLGMWILMSYITENKEMLMQKPPTLLKFDQKLPQKLDGASQSYTPYIRYTKLEFKVWWKE